jgi:hypothetical protein
MSCIFSPQNTHNEIILAGILPNRPVRFSFEANLFYMPAPWIETPDAGQKPWTEVLIEQ